LRFLGEALRSACGLLGPEVPAMTAAEMAKHRGQMSAAAVWGCWARATFRGVKRTAPWLLNYALDTDDAELLAAAWPLVLSLRRCAVARRPEALPPVRWPKDDDCAPGLVCMWRGGGLPHAWRGHFVVGVKYRIPTFVALAPTRRAAKEHIWGAMAQDEPPVEWRFELPESALGDLLCVRSRKSYPAEVEEGEVDMGEVQGAEDDEDEFLLPPHSVVTVVHVQWSNCDTDEDPSKVVLRVSPDSSREPLDLPYGPWR